MPKKAFSYRISKSAKGYMIVVKEGRTKHVYFLRDESHTKESYIPYILKSGCFRLGEPFGNSIFPIYITNEGYNTIKQSTDPIYQITIRIKLSSIWSYYRSFITEDCKPSLIKRYAQELRANLKQMGVDGLYDYVQSLRVI